MIPAERGSIDLLQEFSAATGVKVKTSRMGAAITTMAVGGVVGPIAEPNSEAELCKVVSFLRNANETFRVVGGGSNLLISDAGFAGWVIKLGRGFRFSHKKEDATFEVGASMALMTLSRELSEAGFSGLEFAGGIPASIGGAVRMNAGAHGGAMADIIESVVCVTESGEIVQYGQQELCWAYRKSSIPEFSTVSRITIRLVSSDKQTCAQRRAEFLAERKKRQPLSLPSCGSVFKNPPGNESAGALIERAGLKGASLGGAQISELHANWIVNPQSTASFQDVRGLMKLCQTKVNEKFGVMLEPEVVIWE